MHFLGACVGESKPTTKTLHRLSTEATVLGLRAHDTIRSLPRTSTITPAPKPSTISNDTPLFDEWFDALAPEKQSTLVSRMLDLSRGNSDQNASGEQESEPIEFDWNINTDTDTVFVPQFLTWYTSSSLTSDERNAVFAYAASVRCSDVEADVRRWARSHLKNSPQCMPWLPPIMDSDSDSDESEQGEKEGEEEGEVQGRKEKGNREVDPDLPIVSYPLPPAPAPGYRARLTRGGTLILDDDGNIIWEKIPRNKGNESSRARKA
ncbi:hypothetical protein V5O48_016369 [Marasmius crinis-equi]|uniref:Uncharacterized protein n=1 Tax=Marasmius crinis-equi TaxID=585013 RepID=A0ABR3ES69_9AGAR